MNRIISLILAYSFLFCITSNISVSVLAQEETGSYAAYASVSDKTNIASNSLDGKIETKWSTGIAQTEGMWFTVDLKAPKIITDIILSQGNSKKEYPGRFNVYISDDPDDTGSAVLLNCQGTEAELQNIHVSSATKGQYVRIQLTAGTEANANSWSIHELGFKFAQSIEEAKAVDAKRSANEEAAKTLQILNILKADKNGLRLDDLVKRSEISTILIRTMGMEEVVENTDYDPIYTDVLEGQPAYKAISAATKYGFVSGTGNGTFSPDNSVTFEQAVKMLVTLLGHKIVAEQKGGYPNGYLTVAQEIGLLSHMDSKYGTALTHGDVAQLFSNALDIDLLLPTSMNGASVTYSTVPGKNLMTQYLKVQKIEGRVIANSISTIVGESIMKDDEVMIDSTYYKVGSTNVAEYLGYYVECYILTNYGDRDIIIIANKKENGNKTLTVNARDINREKTTLSEFWYKKDDRLTNVKIALTADMIYNGKALSPFNEFHLTPKAGMVTLLDSDGDSTYDTIFTTSYIYYFIDSINAKDLIVNDKYGQPSLTLNSYSIKRTFKLTTPAGTPMQFKDLKANGLLMVSANRETAPDVNGNKNVDTENANYFTLVYVNSPITGKINEYSPDSVTIDDKEYEISALCQHVTDLTRIGNTGSFTLDGFGEIADITTTKGSMQYGYIMNAGITRGLQKQLRLKLLTQAGEKVIFTCSSHVSIDGEVKKDANAALGFFKNSDNTAKRRMILYSTNDEGDITKIDTSTLGSNEDYDSSLKETAIAEYTYNQWRQMLMTKMNLIIAQDVKIFLVPNPVLGDAVEDNDFKLEKLSYLQHDGKYNVIACDKSDVNVVKTLVIQANTGSGSNTVSGSAAYAMIDRVTRSIDEEGNNAIKVYAVKSDSTVEYYFKDEDVLKNALWIDPVTNKDAPKNLIDGNGNVLLQRGDLVQIETGGRSQITAIKKIIDIKYLKENPPTLYASDSSNYYVASRTVFGQAFAKIGSSFSLVTNNAKPLNQITSADFLESYATTGGTLYDKKTNTVKKLSSDYIKPYKTTHDQASTSYVFIKTEWAEVRVMAVFNLGD